MQEAAIESAFDCASKIEADVIERHDRLVRYLATRFKVDVDDLIQIGRLALLEAHRAWPLKKEHTSTFWTYARKAVLGEMLNYMTSESSRKSSEIPWWGPDEDRTDFPPAFGSNPETVLEARENLALLTERESEILTMYVAGFDVEEIGQKSGISRSRTYQLLKGSVEKIRKRA